MHVVRKSSGPPRVVTDVPGPGNVNAIAAVHMDTEEVMLTELTEDFAEAMAAFGERRTPDFRGA